MNKNYKNITLGEIKKKLGIIDEFMNPVIEKINTLKISFISKYFNERKNVIQENENFVMADKNYKMYKKVWSNSIKYKVICRYKGIDHCIFIKTEKNNLSSYESEIMSEIMKVLTNLIFKNIKNLEEKKMRRFENIKAIKSYSEFINWLTSKELDCEFETRNTNNDRIVIFNPKGSLSEDFTHYTSNNPPKSWNILKTKIEKIIK